MFVKKRIRKISIEEFKKKLEYCCQYRRIVERAREHTDNKTIANLVIKDVKVELTFKQNGIMCTWVTQLDGLVKESVTTPITSYSLLNRFYKVPKLDGQFGHRVIKEFDRTKVYWDYSNIGAEIYNKPNTKGEFKGVYSYDINSSYASAMMNRLPDTEKPEFFKRATKGYVGFNYDGIPQIENNEICRVVFPLVYIEGLQKFANYYYDEKNKSTGSDRQKYKDILNYAIGMLARHNPFLRNTIVHYAREKIKSYFNDNVLRCNTDSLITIGPRTDIEIGDKLGQFKCEHENETFKTNGNGCQWNDSIPTYSGVSKGWFKQFAKINKRPWNILTDKLPSRELNAYKLTRIGDNKYEIKENR